jgi:hypothetical protein
MAFLAYANIIPGKIIFTDNKRENLEDVKEQYDLKNIKLLEIRSMEVRKLAPIPFYVSKIEDQLTILKEKNVWVSDVDVDEQLV